eukprot:3197507-Rhodomonas_salina.1
MPYAVSGTESRMVLSHTTCAHRGSSSRYLARRRITPRRLGCCARCTAPVPPRAALVMPGPARGCGGAGHQR